MSPRFVQASHPHVEGRRRQGRVVFSRQQGVGVGGRHAEHLCRDRRVDVGRHFVLSPLKDLVPFLCLLPVLGPPILEPYLHLQNGF